MNTKYEIRLIEHSPGLVAVSGVVVLVEAGEAIRLIESDKGVAPGHARGVLPKELRRVIEKDTPAAPKIESPNSKKTKESK